MQVGAKLILWRLYEFWMEINIQKNSRAALMRDWESFSKSFFFFYHQNEMGFINNVTMTSMNGKRVERHFSWLDFEFGLDFFCLRNWMAGILNEFGNRVVFVWEYLVHRLRPDTCSSTTIYYVIRRLLAQFATKLPFHDGVIDFTQQFRNESNDSKKSEILLWVNK